jgi:serine/threonine-protein kinase
VLAERYELVALLGRGGMAEVFVAVAHGARGFTRRVAIKRLLPGLGDDATFVARFFDEARIASRLHHANIVGVLDFAIADGAPFQVLELVDGCDVAQLLDRGEPIPVEIALHVTTEVAHALAYAHEAKDDAGAPLGIVHRDVKPSNVLLSRAGEVKLGDFGIALARDRLSVTRTGALPHGTPAFMSPEQLVGGEIGPPSDVFALGCCLHALVAGESPLESQSARMKFLVGGAIALSDTLPADVRAIVERALRREPGDRWPSARAMAAASGAALAARLTTDPKSRVVEWLARAEPARPPEKVPPRTLVASAREGDRRFTETIDAALLATEPARLPSPAPGKMAPAKTAPSRQGIVFAIAVAVPLVVAPIAIVMLRRSPPVVSTDGAPPPPSASAPVRPTDDVPVDVAPLADAALVVDASPKHAPWISAPVAGGCRCDPPPSGVGNESLCHPQTVVTPTCRCKGPWVSTLCWRPYEADGNCVEPLRRQDDKDAVDGRPCRGYFGVDGGLIEGTLYTCHRCEETRTYPHEEGQPCIGIRNFDKKTVRGTISCR